MASLSVCVLVKNEADSLPGLLENVRDLADEIVVLDTGSTDDSAHVAKAAGARVESTNWTDDFGAARNTLLEHATKDWVLMLDADERVAAGSKDKIRSAMKGSHLAYSCTVMNLLPQEVVVPLLPLPSTRLLRRDDRLRYKGRVHESIHDALRRTTRSPESSDIEILHHGFESADRMRHVRNRRLFESELNNDPTEAWIRTHLALNHYYAGDYERANENFRIALSSQTNDLPGTARSMLLALQADVHRREGEKLRQSRSLAIKATQMGGNIFAEYLLAVLDQMEDHPDGALKRYREIDAASIDRRFYRVKRGALYAEIAKVLLKQGKIDEAIEYCELAREEPSYDAMFIGGYLYEQKRNYSRALEFYEIAKPLAAGTQDIVRRIAACRQALA